MLILFGYIFRASPWSLRSFLDSIRCWPVKGWKSLGWEDGRNLAEVSLYCGRGYSYPAVCLLPSAKHYLLWQCRHNFPVSSQRFTVGIAVTVQVLTVLALLSVVYVPRWLVLSCDLYPRGHCNITFRVLGFLTPSTADFFLAYAYYVGVVGISWLISK